MKEEFIRCPFCGGKTRDKILENTILENFPVFCPKCKRETLVNAEKLKIKIVNEPAAKPQSQ